MPAPLLLIKGDHVKIPIPLLLLLLWLAVTSHASGRRELEAMETLRRGFAGSSDFTAEITQEKRLALMKQTLVSRGLVRFKKPGTFFMELYPPHASRLLLKDNVMIMRLVEQGVTDRVVLPPEESLTKWLDYLAKPLISLPEGMDVKAERRGKLWTLQIFPRGKGGVQQLTLNFDSEGTVSRIVIAERNHDKTTLIFSKVRRNVGLEDKDFRVE
jgi:outer membrane lipoprotein carrier protein